MLTEIILVVFIGLNMFLLSSSRLNHCIRLVALQGLLIGLLPVAGMFLEGEWHTSGLAAAAANAAVKGALLPLLLSRAMRKANVSRELEPIVGYSMSVMAAMLAVAAAFAAVRLMPEDSPAFMPLSLPAAVVTMLTGLFLIMARRKALTQVIGFLVFENGITVFGLGMMLEHGFIVELGILLDVFVLVFIMGIAMFQINREFAHIDTDRLNHLGDWSAQEPDFGSDANDSEKEEEQ